MDRKGLASSIFTAEGLAREPAREAVTQRTHPKMEKLLLYLNLTLLLLPIIQASVG